MSDHGDTVKQGTARPSTAAAARATGAIVCAMLVSALLCLFGLEIRGFGSAEEGAAPVGLSLLLLASFFGTSLMFYAAETRNLSKRATTDVDQSIRDLIEELAKKVGIRSKIRCERLLDAPENNLVNGYVYPSGGETRLVLTLRAVDMIRRDDNKVAARLFLLHELGHIAAGDTNLLFLGRAALRATRYLFLLKVIVPMLLPGKMLSKIYQGMLFMESVSLRDSDGIMILSRLGPSNFRAYLFSLLYSGLMFGALVALYVLLVRKREYWADHFAIESASAEAPKAETEMEILLQHGAQARTLAPHGFLGDSTKWHPSTESRINHIRLGDWGARSLEFVGALVIIFLVVVVRVTLGRVIDWSDEDTYRSTAFQHIASYAFIFSLALLIDGLVHHSGTNAHSRGAGYARGVAILLGSALSVSTFLLAVFEWFRSGNGHDSIGIERTGYGALLDIETFDARVIIASIPVIVGVFAATSVIVAVCSGRWARTSAWWIVLRGVVVSGVSVLALLFITAQLAPIVRGYRTERFREYVRGQCSLYDSSPGSRGVSRSRSKRHYSGGFGGSGLEDPLFGIRESLEDSIDAKYARDTVRMEIQIAARELDALRFYPPLEVLDLSVSPFRLRASWERFPEIVNRYDAAGYELTGPDPCRLVR